MVMWEKLAKYCEETFGIYVDWEERFFVCVECDEPIYEEDWSAGELLELGGCCPICGMSWYGEEEDE